VGEEEVIEERDMDEEDTNSMNLKIGDSFAC